MLVVVVVVVTERVGRCLLYVYRTVIGFELTVGIQVMNECGACVASPPPLQKNEPDVAMVLMFFE